MVRIPLIVILSGAMVFAQANTQSKQSFSATSTGAAKASARNTSVERSNPGLPSKALSANSPVITIRGLCSAQVRASQAKSNCKTVLSRHEFEAFIGSMNATTTRGVDPSMYRNMAEIYTALLVNARAGETAAVDKDPRFANILHITRMRALGGMYRVQQVEKALQSSDAEVEAYYNNHRDDFEEVDLDRFLVPKNNPANFSDVAFQEKSKKIADEMHARAVAGEDIAKLEKEALSQLGDTVPPIIAVGVRRGQVEEKADKEIFSLQQDKVTSVLDERGLWMFFKRTNRQFLSLDTVHPEIKGKLFRDKIDQIDKTLHDSVHVDHNEAYFGPDPEARKEADAKSHPAIDSKSAVASDAKTQQKADAPRSVALRDTVLTLHGLCSNPNHADSKDCSTIITREQFEPLLTLALTAPSSSGPASPRSVAKEYIDTLIYGDAAKRSGSDKDPRFADVMELARERALGDTYRLKVEEDARRITKDEIGAYYQKNLNGFDEMKLSHVSVMKEDATGKQDSHKAKALADDLRARASGGEDMDKLQHEAYATLGLKKAPASMMQPLRRGSMEKNTEQEILALKQGGVTTVKDIPSAFVFYKLESRRTVPLHEATPEITYVLYRQRLDKLTRAISGSIRAEYNERYFSSVAPPLLSANKQVGNSAATTK
jgi:hypothetical protein